MKVRLLGLVGLAAAALALTVPSTASASTVTVGSPLNPADDWTATSNTCGGPCTIANTVLAEPGATVSSPVDGTIVRFRIYANSTGGSYKLRVLKPAGGDDYTGAGTSAAVSPTATGIQTFPTSLPIAAGDIVGVDQDSNSDRLALVSGTGATEVEWAPLLADDSTAAGSPTSFEVGLNADVVPQPAVTAISPPSGPLSGGTHVVISGHDFTDATAVSFGGKPAGSASVNSDNQISAVAPAGATTGPVDLTVTTQGGTSPISAADRFTYTPPVVAECIVPKLKGKTLKKVRDLLAAAHCTLGIVAKPKHARAGS